MKDAADVSFPTNDPQTCPSQSTLSEVTPLMLDLLMIMPDE